MWRYEEFFWRYVAICGVMLRYVTLGGVISRYVALSGFPFRFVALCGVMRSFFDAIWRFVGLSGVIW